MRPTPWSCRTSRTRDTETEPARLAAGRSCVRGGVVPPSGAALDRLPRVAWTWCVPQAMVNRGLVVAALLGTSIGCGRSGSKGASSATGGATFAVAGGTAAVGSTQDAASGGIFVNGGAASGGSGSVSIASGGTAGTVAAGGAGGRDAAMIGDVNAGGLRDLYPEPLTGSVRALPRVLGRASNPTASSSIKGCDQISMVRRLPTRTLRGGRTNGLASLPSRNSPLLALAISRRTLARATTSASSRPSGRTTRVATSSTGRPSSVARPVRRKAPASRSPRSTCASPSASVVQPSEAALRGLLAHELRAKGV